MKKYQAILAIFATSVALAVPTMVQASTTTTTHAKKVLTKKSHVKKATNVKPTKPEKNAVVDEDDREPDLAGSTATDYNCELGNKITINENAADPKHVALRWKKHLVRLTQVETTTGAKRYENHKQGFVWIGIPAKGMLLDSKHGQQLANECKSPAQMALKPSDIVTEGAPLIAADRSTQTKPATTIPAAKK
ncbi:MAG: MliC family protein [Herbaspirillum sp.]